MAKTKFQQTTDKFTIMTDFASFRDLAYNQAVTADVMQSQAKWVLDKLPSFPENVSDEVKEDMYEGYRLRFHEKNPPKEYIIMGGKYLLVSELSEVPVKAERVSIGVDFAMGFTQQAFGALKNDKSPTYNPALHEIVGGIRTKVNKYCSNRFRDLGREVTKLRDEKEGKTKTRAQAKGFAEYLMDTFDTMQTRCKTAKVQRGDETANLDLFIAAKLAFMAKWNSGK